MVWPISRVWPGSTKRKLRTTQLFWMLLIPKRRALGVMGAPPGAAKNSARNDGYLSAPSGMPLPLPSIASGCITSVLPRSLGGMVSAGLMLAFIIVNATWILVLHGL